MGARNAQIKREHFSLRKISEKITSFVSHMNRTALCIDTRLQKSKHQQKRFQDFRQSYMLSADQIEIHQSQPASMSGCDLWISIRSDLSITRKSDGNIGKVSASVLISEVAHQCKRWYKMSNRLSRASHDSRDFGDSDISFVPRSWQQKFNLHLPQA